MFKLSDNYYLRKSYLKSETVPTQTVIKDKMSPPLAKVYFNSMNQKIKVLAGLEPRMKGGGADWYIPPDEVLRGRVVSKPIKNEYLQQLGFNGIASFGDHLIEQHRKRMKEEKRKVLLESDINWKKNIEVSCRQQWEDSSHEAALANTAAIQRAFHEFTTMYSSSITKIETVLFDAAVKDIQMVRDAAFKKMKAHYDTLLHDQATMLYERYTKKLMNEKAKLKEDFIKKVEETRTRMANRIHDINLEKHIAIEKLRQLLESLNLACQVYVALKEREECQKEMEISQHKQQKKVTALKQQIALKDFEIRLALEKEKKRDEFNKVWQKKICAVVKKFQMFASFCLREMPEHADFFIDMEKLMMIQLSEIIENPAAESIFVPEEPKFHTPVPRPHPFYLFCDKGYKPQLDPDLCPKHCTSSASQLPVVVVNKRFIYGACDNFEQFTDKITEFIHGRRGEDIDSEDDHVYENDVPVTVTRSQQLLELKLQSSIMQILQEELPNVKEVPIECCMCRIPYCFCSPTHNPKTPPIQKQLSPSLASINNFPSKHPVREIRARSAALKHEREPKWESYMNYIMPKKCKCGKRAKKHLEEHLPAYMRNTSAFQQPNLPNYEMCPLTTMKKLVKRAQGTFTPPLPEEVEVKARDVSTQYSDQNFEYLCTCYSDEEVKKLFGELSIMTDSNQFKVVGDEMLSDHLSQQPSSFALRCAHSLRNFLEESPQIKEIFRQKSCHYD